MKRKASRLIVVFLAFSACPALAQSPDIVPAVSFPKLESRHAETYRLAQYPLVVRYAIDARIKRLQATMNERDISEMFSPGKAHEEVVMVPLEEGRNVLTVDVQRQTSNGDETRRYKLTIINREELSGRIRARSARGELAVDRDVPEMAESIKSARRTYLKQRFGLDAPGSAPPAEK